MIKMIQELQEMEEDFNAFSGAASPEQQRIMLSAIRRAMVELKDYRAKYDPDVPLTVHLIDVSMVVSHECMQLYEVYASLLYKIPRHSSTTADDLEEEFGKDVVDLIRELAKARGKTKAERKRRHVETFTWKSEAAQRIILADKIVKLKKLSQGLPSGWTEERRTGFYYWVYALWDRMNSDDCIDFYDIEDEFETMGMDVQKIHEQGYAPQLEAYYKLCETLQN